MQATKKHSQGNLQKAAWDSRQNKSTGYLTCEFIFKIVAAHNIRASARAADIRPRGWDETAS